MIIKSIFRRYERWNPVHPTYGAFWGIGIGVGCGIGWGPGFGPEVIGYVGAGCGAGFNVGFTLLGAGIGFPANHIYKFPHKGAVMVTRRGVSLLDVVRARIDNTGDVKSMLLSHADHITHGLQRLGRSLVLWDKDSKT